MKKLTLLLVINFLFLLSLHQLYAQAPACNIITNSIIAQQDFEASPATPEMTYTESNTAISSGQGTFPNDNMFVSGSQGRQINNANGTITFDAVDTSKYHNIEFSIRLASFSATSNNGCDKRDEVSLKIRNGTYSKEILISGKEAGNNRWSFTSGTGTALVTYDGDNTPTEFRPTTNGDVTAEGYSTIKITNLPATKNLNIQLKIKNDHADEIWVVDDAILKGDYIEYTVWDNGAQAWTNGVPTATTKAFFETSYNMANSWSNVSVTACACEIKNNKSVTIKNEKYLEIGNDIVNNGTIRIRSRGALIQINNSPTSGTGTFIVEKKTTAYTEYDYTYWSSPLETADIFDVFNTNSTLTNGSSTNSDNFSPTNHIYKFITANFDDANNNTYDDNNDDWSIASGNMIPAKGYIAMGAGADFPFDSANIATGLKQKVKFIGDKANNGDISIPVSLDANNSDNFNNQNLIGNPYPCSIDGEKFINDNSNVGTLYFWTHHTPIATGTAGTDTDAYNFTNDDYATFTTAGYAASASGATVPSDKLIGSCQGFFADISTAGTVTFTNSMKDKTNNANFFKSNTAPKNRIWVNLTNENGLFRQILVGFFNDATTGYDRIYDGHRAFNGENYDFYSLLNNKKFAIQALPQIINETTLPLGISILETGNFTFTIDRFEGELENTNIYIKDNLLDIVHNLKLSDYLFNTNQIGDINNRFELVFNRTALDIETVNSLNNVLQISQNNNTINLQANKTIKQVLIYNLLGQNLKAVNTNSNQVAINKNTFKNGTILLVKAAFTNGKTVTKKIITH
jgi:hypothetical protein